VRKKHVDWSWITALTKSPVHCFRRLRQPVPITGPEEGNQKIVRAKGRSAGATTRMPTSYSIVAVIGLLIANFSAAQSNSAAQVPPAPDRASTLSLPWKDFDQTQDSGWRWYVNPPRRQYLEAAKLIEEYLERHNELPPRQRALCQFHAAHLFIFRPIRTGVGDPLEALPYLEKAIVPSGATPPSADWNDLVFAMKAFLTGDRATLIAIKDRVAAMSPETVKFLKPPNAPEDLLNNLGKPFGSWFPQAEPKK
jgi:hypothetical protein